MAFNVLAEIATDIPTAKDGESVNVQVVQISFKDGRVENRAEARVFVDNSADGGYCGPTKSALTFKTVDAINELIQALEQARAMLPLGTVVPAPQVVKARPIHKVGKGKARKAG